MYGRRMSEVFSISTTRRICRAPDEPEKNFKGFPCKRTYVDRPETSTVAGSHVLVETLDGVGAGEVTELLVHLVGAGARVVANPDAKVLDFERLLLVDLAGRGQPRSVLPYGLPLGGYREIYGGWEGGRGY